MKDNKKKVKLTEEEAKKEVQTEEEGVQLTDEELEQVTGGKAGAIPLGGDSVAAKFAEASTGFEVIKRIVVVTQNADQVAVKLAIDEVARR